MAALNFLSHSANQSGLQSLEGNIHRQLNRIARVEGVRPTPPPFSLPIILSFRWLGLKHLRVYLFGYSGVSDWVRFKSYGSI